LGAIFIEGDIADIMASVFDAPVSPVDFQELFRRRFVRFQAGNQINGFTSFLAGFEDFRMAFDAGDLPTEREIDVIIQIGGGPDFSYFQSAMCFFTGFVLRGENCRSIQDRQYPP
jgi:hypothetical protein